MAQITPRARAGAWITRHKILAAVFGLSCLIVMGGLSLIAARKPAFQEPSDASSSVSAAEPGQNKIPITMPAPAAPPTPKVYTGAGDDVVPIEKPADGAVILAFECDNCTDNTVVKTNGPNSLIVNTIGAYTGSHLIDYEVGANTTQVTVTASGSWKITISGLDQTTEVSSQGISGQGDSVLHLAGSTTEAAITNTGDDNFVVEAYPDAGGQADLAVNTIGSYKGTVPLVTPAYVQITSNGSWSLTPR